jgi:hypothetical protein
MRVRTKRAGTRLLLPALVCSTALTAVGCFTSSVLDRARDGDPELVPVERFERAATKDEQLYLLLDVRNTRSNHVHSVVLRIPFGEIGLRRYPDEPSFRDGGLTLLPPLTGYLERGNAVPTDAEPLPIEQLTFPTFADREDYLKGLTGIHVLRTTVIETDQALGLAPGPEDRRRNESGVLIVRGARGQDPQESAVGSFTEAPKGHAAWYLLTPLSVVGDAVTSPVQLIAIILAGGCANSIDASEQTGANACHDGTDP